MKDEKSRPAGATRSWALSGMSTVFAVTVVAEVLWTPTLTGQVGALCLFVFLGVWAVIDHLKAGTRHLQAISEALQRIEERAERIEVQAAARQVDHRRQASQVLQLLEAILAHQPEMPNLRVKEGEAG